MGPHNSLSAEQLTEAHLPLVRAIARRYAGRGEDLEDLVQLGSVGLVKASKRFDPTRGVSFANFAAPAIEGEIRRHLRDQASPVRIPRRLDEMSAKLRRSDVELSASLGRSPTLSELASELGVDEDDVKRALSVDQAREAVSVSAEGTGLELPSDTATLSDSDDRLLLARSIRALEERERRIVFLRFHADMTERQIGRELGISQAHVSRLLAGALVKLRNDLERGGDSPRSRDITPVIPPTDRTADPGNDTMGQTENLTLAEYLELPYRVEVRGERNKNGSVWKATVEELPGCVARGGTADEAVAQLRLAMEAWLGAAIADNRKIPVPGGDATARSSARSHSGRFLLRMPKSLHEELALAAAREHVSLNRFLTETLADSLSPSRRSEPSTRSEREVESDGADGAPAPDRNLRLDEAPTPSEATAPVTAPAPRTFRVALATNLAVVIIAGVIALFLLIVALERGI